MSDGSLAGLTSDAQQQFQAALGPGFKVTSREVLSPTSFRGGFRLVFVCASREVVVFYADLELEVTCNDQELFGPTLHVGFEGNMFSREHLAKALPRIATSSIGQLRVAG
jgi:hypothetical protein